MDNHKNEHIGVRIFGKLCLIVFLALLLFSFVAAWSSSLIDYNRERHDRTERIASCDMRYYDREFGNLREILLLYDLFDESIYGKYWEAVNAYEDYTYYLQWQQAAEKGVQGADEKLEEYSRRVQTNNTNCQYEENKRVLQDYADWCTR